MFKYSFVYVSMCMLAKLLTDIEAKLNLWIISLGNVVKSESHIAAL